MESSARWRLRRTAYTKPSRRLGGLAERDWVRGIGTGPRRQSRFGVKQPEVEHKVRMSDFEAWLESNGLYRRRMTLKSRLRELLGQIATPS
jgi:hypothetical protein